MNQLSFETVSHGHSRRLFITTGFVLCLSLVGCKSSSLFSRDTAKPIEISSASEALAAIRESRDPNLRRAAFRYLGNPQNSRGDDARRDEFSEVLGLALASETDVQAQLELLRALDQLGSPNRTSALLGAAEDKDTAVRVMACRMLGRTKSPAVVSKLESLLASDASLDVRLAAADALGQIPSRESAMALVSSVNSSDVALRHRSRESLKQILGTDHAANVDQWQQEIQTATFEEPARKPLRLF